MPQKVYLPTYLPKSLSTSYPAKSAQTESIVLSLILLLPPIAKQEFLKHFLKASALTAGCITPGHCKTKHKPLPLTFSPQVTQQPPLGSTSQ